MSGFAQFVVRRLLFIPITLLIVTLILYGIAALAPLEARAKLYWPPGASEQWMALADPEEITRLNELVIKQYGLDDPFLVQYGRWITELMRGDWGSSSSVNEVLPAIIQRAPVTIELTLYSVLLLIPLGLASGVVAGWRKDHFPDNTFRSFAFLGTSIPPFILGLLLLAVFYVIWDLFPPGRVSIETRLYLSSPTSSFQTYTGLITIDGLLNGRMDVTLDALRHLVLPVFTLSLAHWATLGRVTRASMIDEMDQHYITAARGRGLSDRDAAWKHALRNAILPGMNSIAVSMAALITGVFVIETIFNFNGISELIIYAVSQFDLALTLGLTIYSVLLILPIMFALDILQAIIDPRVRGGSY